MFNSIVVRFAPSPTGYLHVGGARTAIFNWLFARSTGGKFLLRIEDTDKERSSEEMVRAILDGLKWLGLDWDEPPMRQSNRSARHRAECLRLLESGHAYWCRCSAQEVEERRTQLWDRGVAYRCPELCRNSLSTQAPDENAVLRFKVPEGKTHFNDIVHDAITFENSEIEDFVLLRSDGTPVYNVAVVVDDHDMDITHILRGDDHLSNTPKQIQLYRALGYDVPQFGHLPLILGPDKKRLSKRHGATAIGEYQMRGYLPSALVNYLALLGWSPGGDREIMTLDELIEAFDIRRVLKKSAVFDEEKLRWINGQHIRRLSISELMERLRPYIDGDVPGADNGYLERVVRLMQERMTVLPDLFNEGWFFFKDPESYDEKGVKKHWKPQVPVMVEEILAELEKCDFTAASVE